MSVWRFITHHIPIRKTSLYPHSSVLINPELNQFLTSFSYRNKYFFSFVYRTWKPNWWRENRKSGFTFVNRATPWMQIENLIITISDRNSYRCIFSDLNALIYCVWDEWFNMYNMYDLRILILCFCIKITRFMIYISIRKILPQEQAINAFEEKSDSHCCFYFYFLNFLMLEIRSTIYNKKL